MRMVRVLAGIACIITAFSAPAFAGNMIKVGAILAVSGPASFLGAPEAKTLEMLVEDINAKGGINGAKLHIVTAYKPKPVRVAGIPEEFRDLSYAPGMYFGHAAGQLCGEAAA